MYKLTVDETLNFGFYVHRNMRLQWFNIMTLTLGGLNVYRGFFFFATLKYITVFMFKSYASWFCNYHDFEPAYCILSCHLPFSYRPPDRRQVLISGIHISAA